MDLESQYRGSKYHLSLQSQAQIARTEAKMQQRTALDTDDSDATQTSASEGIDLRKFRIIEVKRVRNKEDVCNRMQIPKT